MIWQYGVPGRVQVLSCFDRDSSIRAHTSYVQAKAGEPQAALDLISDLHFRCTARQRGFW